MSIQALGAPAATGEGVPGVLAAGERVQRLQTLLAQVERGSASFAAELDAAQSQTASGGAGGASDGAFAASGASTATPTAGGATGSSYSGLIDQAAARNGIEPAVLYGLIQQESGFDPSATSSAGALGLTQLMPGTAASLGVTEPLDPAQSIEGGARYLGGLLRQFGGNVPDALAAYNAGPGAVQQYGGIPPYAETEQYVSKVLANADAYRSSGATGLTTPAISTTAAVSPGMTAAVSPGMTAGVSPDTTAAVSPGMTAGVSPDTTAAVSPGATAYPSTPAYPPTTAPAVSYLSSGGTAA